MSWLEKAKNALFGHEDGAPPAAPAQNGRDVSRPSDSVVAAELVAQIVELSSDGLSAAHLDLRAHLFDYGYLDSMSAVSLIGFIGQRYGVEISESDLIGALDCIDALARHIEHDRGAA
ncbi:MAG: acyl carrier protein [Myxococcales bacterium]|nr:acyl carrier protein [Myxococcales bacterium]